MKSKDQSSQKKLLCFCNKVSEESAIELINDRQITDLKSFQDLTQAGCGPCGGSCQGRMKQLLREHLNSTPINQFCPPLPRDFVKAISLFNRRYYWETHEVLEDIWREETGERRLFYQALIQAAAALYHVLNDNPKGVLKLVPESLNKFKASPQGNPWKIDILPLITALNSYKTQSEEILALLRVGFDYRLLPRIELNSDIEVES